MFSSHLRRALRSGLFLALLPALAACPPPPQPFAHGGRVGEEEQALLAMPDSQGILVSKIEGVDAETADKLAEAMAEALAEANVPASTTIRNAASYFLTARIAASPIDESQSKLLVLWELRDHEGGLVGSHLQHETVAQQAWEQGQDTTVEQITGGAAPQVASFIQEELPGVGTGSRARAVVAIMPVKGAPGDGDQQLPRAIRYFLEQAGYEVTNDLTEATAVIMGTVEAGTPRSGAQKVAMSWSVMTPGGEEVGVVNLENVVPEGALDGHWGETAYAAAGGAAEGITAILERLSEPNPKF
ncbi:MAG: hypothetical protein HOH66_03945 [Rhodospirillaceae bacterium]|nr:hypothetical protein [Rhodospirillaceae bacterium]MBT6116995.1 hypothetical protein [Rhodospirillaceae bacterium]